MPDINTAGGFRSLVRQNTRIQEDAKNSWKEGVVPQQDAAKTTMVLAQNLGIAGSNPVKMEQALPQVKVPTGESTHEPDYASFEEMMEQSLQDVSIANDLMEGEYAAVDTNPVPTEEGEYAAVPGSESGQADESIVNALMEGEYAAVPGSESGQADESIVNALMEGEYAPVPGSDSGYADASGVGDPSTESKNLQESDTAPPKLASGSAASGYVDLTINPFEESSDGYVHGEDLSKGVSLKGEYVDLTTSPFEGEPGVSAGADDDGEDVDELIELIKNGDSSETSSSISYLDGRRLVVGDEVTVGTGLVQDETASEGIERSSGKLARLRNLTSRVRQQGIKETIKSIAGRVLGKKSDVKPLSERKIEVLKFSKGDEIARGNYKTTVALKVDQAASQIIGETSAPSQYVLQEYHKSESEMQPRDLEEKKNEEEANLSIYAQHQKDPASVSHLAFGKPIEFKSVDGTTRTAYIAERADKGALSEKGKDKMKQIPPEQRGSYALQMARGVAQFHALGKVHGDVKPDNFLVASGEKGDVVKLTDYGKACDPGTKVSHCPVQYYDPHTFASSNVVATQENDVYSLGMNLYMVCTGTDMEDIRKAYHEEHGSMTGGMAKARDITNGTLDHPKEEYAKGLNTQRREMRGELLEINSEIDEIEEKLASGEVNNKDQLNEKLDQLKAKKQELQKETDQLREKAALYHKQAVSESFTAFMDLEKIENPQVREVVRDILHNPPEKRPTAAQVEQRLQVALSRF